MHILVVKINKLLVEAETLIKTKYVFVLYILLPRCGTFEIIPSVQVITYLA